MDKILVITQCFPCGSWLCIEKIVEEISKENVKVRVLGLGKPSERIEGFKYHLIPFFEYTKYGNLTCVSPVFGFLWNIPLYIFSIFLILFTFPRAVIYNSLAIGLILSPIFKLLGRKNIIMYHSVIGHYDKRTKKIVKFLFKFVDQVVVNSLGSKNDLRGVTPSKKILVNDHYADDVFFNQPLKKNPEHNRLNVLYVGRIDKDKRCFPLIDFAKKMKNNPNFYFTFVGGGSDVEVVKKLAKGSKNIIFGGYINKKSDLAKLYQKNDILWSFADVTYLALPAVEALATDRPIIIPKYAAIAGKDELIDKKLVPRNIGFLVDPFSQKNIETVMNKIQREKLYLDKKCREYANLHYSRKNLEQTAKLVKKVINS